MMLQQYYSNLLAQFDKVFRHNRQGSYKTRYRYAEAFRRFLLFLAQLFHLERLPNIAPKHLYAYVDYLTERGLSAAYIKTELSAIRFYHDQIPGARYALPDNSKLGLARRRFGGIDRTWSNAEFNRFLAKAASLGREDYIAVLCLARYAALRIHECFRLDTYAAEQALKGRVLTVKGKGGLVRQVPVNDSIRIELRKMLERTPKGGKLFVQQGDKTHLAIHRLESFINYHKAELQDLDSGRPLTFHGLRHVKAAEWYGEYLHQGYSELEGNDEYEPYQKKQYYRQRF